MEGKCIKHVNMTATMIYLWMTKLQKNGIEKNDIMIKILKLT